MTLAASPDGNRLFAGGFFTTMAGVARSGLAALNAATGALDAAFNPAPSAGGVETMALTPAGRLLLGGGFTKIGATTRNRLAAVNAATGALDTVWAPSADGTVHTLRLSRRRRQGVRRRRLRQHRRQRPQPAGPPVRDRQRSARRHLETGGRRRRVGARPVGRRGPALRRRRLHQARAVRPATTSGRWPATGAGAVDGWDPNASMPAMTVAPSPVGVFRRRHVRRRQRHRPDEPGRLRCRHRRARSRFVANTDKAVRAILPSADGASLYVGGLFKKVNGAEPGRLAKLNATTGAVAGGWAPKASAEVKALALAGSKLYVGGAFSSVNGSTRNRAAAVDAASGALSSWNPNVSNVVWAMAVSPDAKTIYLGGAFSTVKGSTRKNIAAVSASTRRPTSWKPAVTAPLRRLEAAGSQVFVTLAGLSTTGGNRVVAFSAGTGPSSGRARPTVTSSPWPSTGRPSTPAATSTSSPAATSPARTAAPPGRLRRRHRRPPAWAPTVSGSHGVWALWASGGSVIAGGDFQVVAATVSAGLARFPGT